MVKKKIGRIKHFPQRTCVGCRSVTSKREMIRLVKTENGIVIDPTGKMDGRGIYLHDNRACWENGLKGSIAKGLKIVLSDDDQKLLEDYLEILSAEFDQTNEEKIDDK